MTAVTTMLSWRSHATMVTLGLEKLSSSIISSALAEKNRKQAFHGTTPEGHDVRPSSITTTILQARFPPQSIEDRREGLPGECGGHFEQDGLPLLSMMELPDPSGPVLTSTHKPETAKSPSDPTQDSCGTTPLKEPEGSTIPFTGVAKLDAVHFVLQSRRIIITRQRMRDCFRLNRSCGGPGLPSEGGVLPCARAVQISSPD